MDKAPFRYGPTGSYIACLDAQGHEIVSVHYSDGRLPERLNPNPYSPRAPEFAWGYCGGGAHETAAAILSHYFDDGANGDRPYTERVEDLCRAFADAFFGDVHHDEVENGFVLPGEMIGLWIYFNEAQVKANDAIFGDRGVSMSGLMATKFPESRVASPEPNTLRSLRADLAVSG